MNKTIDSRDENHNTVTKDEAGGWLEIIITEWKGGRESINVAGNLLFFLGWGS